MSHLKQFITYDQFVTCDQMAEMLHRTPKAFHRLRERDRYRKFPYLPPSIKIGNQVLYKKQVVLSWLNDLEGEV